MLCGQGSRSNCDREARTWLSVLQSAFSRGNGRVARSVTDRGSTVERRGECANAILPGVDSVKPSSKPRAAIPLRVAEILHLLRNYQAVIHGRPLEMSNTQFLAGLITAGRRLARSLALAPANPHVSAVELDHVVALAESQTPANAKEVAG